MSFLSKNWAGLSVCLIISITSWVLGGFLPVVGAPVFAIFIGMILHPFLTSYTQLDAGLTYSSKKLLQYAVILLGFGLNISQVFAVGKSSHPFSLLEYGITGASRPLKEENPTRPKQSIRVISGIFRRSAPVYISMS